MFLLLTFWSVRGIFSSLARIQPLAHGYFGWKMVSCSMRNFFLLKMLLICISKKTSEWVNRRVPGKDLLVDCYYAFLRPTAWIYDACILDEQFTHQIFSQWNRLRVSFGVSKNFSLNPPSFSYNNWCKYCKKKFLFLQIVLLHQVLSLERNLLLPYSFLAHFPVNFPLGRKWMFP